MSFTKEMEIIELINKDATNIYKRGANNKLLTTDQNKILAEVLVKLVPILTTSKFYQKIKASLSSASNSPEKE